MTNNNTVIGKLGMLTVTFRNGDQLQFEVCVKDLKQHFGRIEYLVTPVAGSGQAWKSEHNIDLFKH